jgi:antitoxin HigA-1
MSIMKTITKNQTMRMLNPVHPGRFLRTEIIEAHGLSVTGAAKILRVSRTTLSSLLNARADLSGDMALRIEKAFGVEMDTLMRMQSSVSFRWGCVIHLFDGCDHRAKVHGAASLQGVESEPSMEPLT